MEKKSTTQHSRYTNDRYRQTLKIDRGRGERGREEGRGKESFCLQ